jgi:CBS domain-containing protein
VAAQSENLVIGGTSEFLRKFPPFDEMEGAALAFIAESASLGYYAKGDVVLAPENGVPQSLFIVQRGFVVAPGTQGDADRFEFGPGESFSVDALLGGRPTRRTYTAEADTFCYVLPAAAFEEAMHRSPVFRRHATRRMDSLMQQAAAQMRNAYSAEALGQNPMNAPLASLIAGPPVACRPETPLRDALAMLRQGGVRSIVATDAGGVPVGILTEGDLLRHVVEEKVDLAQPVIGYMTREPIGLPPTATAYEAVIEMTKRNIGHILVVDQGKLAGVLSERALFALQRTSMRHALQAIEHANDDAAMQAAAGEIAKVARSMLAQNVGAEQLTQLIAALNDKLTERILALEAGRHDLAGIRFCWLALGSRGRQEQTFAAEQDNAIVFAVREGAQAEDIRGRLLPFARAVNATLDRCGFPVGRANLMASNPRWTLAEAEWLDRFGGWLRAPVREAVAEAAIVFDFRPIWGDFALAATLRDRVSAEARESQDFPRAMAALALETPVPISFLGEIQISTGQGGEGTIDLKTQGTRLFTDLARVYALAQGIPQTRTAVRLRAAGAKLEAKPDEVEAMVGAFHFLLLLRLRQRHSGATPGDDPDRLRPEGLNELDRRILKEAFRQARKGQKRLRLDYQR